MGILLLPSPRRPLLMQLSLPPTCRWWSHFPASFHDLQAPPAPSSSWPLHALQSNLAHSMGSFVCVKLHYHTFGWWLVLITFLTLQLDNGAQEHMMEELHQYWSTCYEIWLKQSASIHLWTWDRALQSLSWPWLVFEYDKCTIIKKLKQLTGKICKSKRHGFSNPSPCERTQ